MRSRYGGLSFNRAEFGRSRGVACSASEEFEYEESLQFAKNETYAAFVSRAIMSLVASGLHSSKSASNNRANRRTMG